MENRPARNIGYNSGSQQNPKLPQGFGISFLFKTYEQIININFICTMYMFMVRA